MIAGVPEYAAPFFWASLLGAGADPSRGKDAVSPGSSPTARLSRPRFSDSPASDRLADDIAGASR
jgi:hypothetical protein